MAKRKPDVITIHGERGVMDRFDEVTFSASLLGPAQAKLVTGDADAWTDLQDFILPGYEYQLKLNNTTVMKGRVEAYEVPADSTGGVRYELTLRTRLSDARYSSADPLVKTSNTSIKDFLLAIFGQHGFAEKDFLLEPYTATNLITGKQKGHGKTSAIAAITAQDAKVQPPETVMECAMRHLDRHGEMLWDAPDGRIVVGAPDDQQEPTYRFICKRGAESVQNNVKALRRIGNWSEVASGVSIIGQSSGKENSKIPVRASAFDRDVQAVVEQRGHFFRPVYLPAERIKSNEEAQRKAAKELSARRRSKDAFEIVIDGWTYWDGERAIPIAINTTTDVDFEVPTIKGRYLVWRFESRLSRDAGGETTIGIVGPGAWIL